MGMGTGMGMGVGMGVGMGMDVGMGTGMRMRMVGAVGPQASIHRHRELVVRHGREVLAYDHHVDVRAWELLSARREERGEWSASNAFDPLVAVERR